MFLRSIFSFPIFLLVLMPSLLCGGEAAGRDRYGDPLPEGAVARLGTTRLRVDQNVRAFAFWPDDKTLAACCWDGSVRFWERATGREIRRLQTPISDIRAAVFVPKTKAAALLGEENQFILWDSAAGKTVWKISLPDYDRSGGCLAVSPDGKMLAIPETEGKVGLYETASGRKIRSLEEAEGSTLVFSPDSTLLAIAPSKPPSHLWDIRSGKKVRDLPSPESLFFDRALAFSHDGKMVAVGSFTHAVVSEVATGKEISRLHFHYDITQRGLLFTADGKTLITGHYPGEVHFWDTKTGKERFLRKTNWDQGAWPVLSHDGKALAVADQQGREYRFIRLLDPETGKDVGAPADGHESQMNYVVFSLDGKTVLSSGRKTIREWKAATGEPGRQIRRRVISDDAPVFSADRKLLALPSDERVYLWQLGRDKPMLSLEYKGKDAIRAVAFAPDGKYLLSAHNKCSPQFGKGKIEGEDGLHFWDLSKEKETRSFSTPAKALYSHLLITPDGRTAIAGSVNGSVSRFEHGTSTSTSSSGAGQLYLWDLRSNREIRTLEGHKGAILSLALSSDGRLLASGSADQTFRLWELASGKTLFTVPAGKTYRPVTAISPDGRLLATGSGPDLAEPFTICLYSTATGKPVLQLRGHNSQVNCVAFSPDNQRLATGLSDGTGLVWDVSAACRTVRPEARRLSAKERETLWTGLADADAISAQRAVWTLIAGGNDAVAMLKERLHPAEVVAPKRLEKLVADLDSDQFAVREAATQEFDKLGERAETVLSAALKNRPSLEVRKRIEELLTRLYRKEHGPQQLREMRAVMVLEHVGSEEAREVLQSLAKGDADAWLTREVEASLVRIIPKRTQSEPRP